MQIAEILTTHDCGVKRGSRSIQKSHLYRLTSMSGGVLIRFSSPKYLKTRLIFCRASFRLNFLAMDLLCFERPTFSAPDFSGQ